jgi:hypothetical protein
MENLIFALGPSGRYLFNAPTAWSRYARLAHFDYEPADNGIAIEQTYRMRSMIHGKQAIYQTSSLLPLAKIRLEETRITS